jgi:uncharacterized protein YbjT (DUF2867 family)
MTRQAHTALLAGASGLVGGECLRLLLASDRYERVLVLTRRDLGAVVAGAPKVEQVVGDFARLDEFADALRAGHVFCALGTTIRKAGSQAKFREVDFEYPRRLAAIARRNGAQHFSLVSAMGASRASPFFYSRVKGEVEDAVQRMDWPSLCIVRPSVIAGERAEPRPFERLAETALRFAPAAWRPVPARDIAAAMVATALRSPPGTTVLESRDIPKAARAAVAQPRNSSGT